MCIQVSSCWVTIAFSHNTSSQFCKARRFELKMAQATRPKRRALQNWLLVLWEKELVMCFQVRTISLRHFIHIHFCVWLGLFVDRWWLKEVWYAPDLLSNCSTRVSLAAPGITRSPSERICRGRLSQKTRNWPTCNGKPVHGTWTQPREAVELHPTYSVDNLTQLRMSLASEARRLNWCSSTW